MAKFTFTFQATQLFGFHQESEPRAEVITITARSFKKAVELLKIELNKFRESQYFERFFVSTKDSGKRLVLIDGTVLGSLTNHSDSIRYTHFSVLRGNSYKVA